MERIIVLDTETTGVTPSDRIVELAWIEIDQNLNEVDRFRTLVDPEMLISPSAMGVHHITDADVESAPTIAQVFSVVRPKEFDGDQVVLVGHNCEFDCRYVQDHIPVKEQVCTLRLARHFWPDAPDHKLQTMRYFHKLRGGKGAHGALEDCETTLALLRHICGEQKIGLEWIRRLCRGTLRVHRIPFGKHRGSKISELPRGYKVWLLGTDLDPDLRAAVIASLK